LKNLATTFTSLLVTLLFFTAGSALAQTATPNASIIAGGHMHLVVPNVAKHREIWKLLGGVERSSGPLKVLMFPGMFILFTEGQPSAPSVGTTVSQFGFTINDYGLFKAKLEAVGAHFISDDGAGQILADLPDGVRVEMVLDAEQEAPIAFHHTNITAEDGETLRQWYVDVFGGQVSERGGLSSAVILGDRINFLPAVDATPLPTQGTAIDHIGFEVADLDAFAKKMGPMGIAFDREPFCIEAINLCIAFMTDPAGTYIELTEGLARLR